MNLYVLRHGQTDWNILKKVQGKAEIPLNEKGIEQAKEVRDQLNEMKFDFIYCSTLGRAKQTADIINEDRKIEIIYDERLEERDFGEFEGQHKESFPYYEFWSYSFNKRYERAENIRTFFERISQVLDEIKLKHKGKDVLLVGHAGVLRAIECLEHGMMSDEEIATYMPKNGDIVVYSDSKTRSL